jgi:hypothetical protein
MSVLFKKEELINGIIVEGQSTTSKTPLDKERLEILKSN